MNTHRINLTTTLALTVLLGVATQMMAKPNVVLIVCDDLNDFVTGMDGHPQARTPHIEKLARKSSWVLVLESSVPPTTLVWRRWGVGAFELHIRGKAAHVLDPERAGPRPSCRPSARFRLVARAVASRTGHP